MTATAITTHDEADATLVDVEAEICALGAAISISRARLLELVGQFDAADGWVPTGAISCAHWLADVLDIEVSTAREQVRVARSLRQLPATSQAFALGDVSYAKVRHLTRVATARHEQELLTLAGRHPAGQLARVLADWQLRNDPAGAARRQYRERGLSVRTQPTGNRTISIELPAHEAAFVEAVIDAEVMAAPKGASEPGAPLRHQRADAFVRLIHTVTANTNDAPAGASRAPRVELVLHRRLGETTLADGTPLPAAVARQVTCDSDLRVMTHLPNGSPADVGRRHRLVTPRLRRLVFERDGGRCQHPGCEARHFLEVHHKIHWEDGGPTDLDNLELRCGYHHRLEHQTDG